MNSDFNTDEFRAFADRNWPTVSKNDDEAWHSTWTFELASPIDTKVDLESVGREFSSVLSRIAQRITGNPEHVFTVSLRSDVKHLYVHTTTTWHLIGAENMSALLKLFKLIESRFGRIVSIQHQPRDVWPRDSW